MGQTTITDGLTLKVPTAGTQGWAGSFLTDFAKPISGHDHSGGGKGNPIGTAGIASKAVTTAKIADAAVDTLQIKDGAVTAAKFASLLIDTPNLVDAAVTTAKLHDASVTAAKIVDGTITAAKLASTAVILDRANTAFSSLHQNATTVYAALGNAISLNCLPGDDIELEVTFSYSLTFGGGRGAIAFYVDGVQSSADWGVYDISGDATGRANSTTLKHLVNGLNGAHNFQIFSKCVDAGKTINVGLLTFYARRIPTS